MSETPNMRPNEPPPPHRKTYRYTPFSIIAAPLGLGFGLTFGKAIGEAMEWGKLATISAECGISGVVALILSLAINFFFGKDLDLTSTQERPLDTAPEGPVRSMES